MTVTLLLIAALAVLVLLAFERERQRKARQRASKALLLSYIDGLRPGLEANTKARWY